MALPGCGVVIVGQRSIELTEMIETERLELRPYQPGDGSAYFTLCMNNKEHLLPFEAGNPALLVDTEEDAKSLVEDLAAAWTTQEAFPMGVWRKADGALVGQIYVGVVSRKLAEFSVGYFVDKDLEGKGYASEAVRGTLGLIFDHLGARRVRLCCCEANVRSVRVAERCGFVREGLLREASRHKLPDGTPAGECIYGMLRSEYVKSLPG